MSSMTHRSSRAQNRSGKPISEAPCVCDDLTRIVPIDHYDKFDENGRMNKKLDQDPQRTAWSQQHSSIFRTHEAQLCLD
jgi:hypothetical protein